MRTNQELEFKCFITEDEYNSLIDEFDLKENIFPQTNHYFDTDDLYLKNHHIVLRIRQKGDNFKLTKKVHQEAVGSLETHIFLNKDEADNMLENGFNASNMDLDMDVTNICALTTYRASTPYKDGVIFFDKSVYYGHTDYEIEYEVDDWEIGKKIFEEFLEERNIKFKPAISKSVRAFSTYK